VTKNIIKYLIVFRCLLSSFDENLTYTSRFNCEALLPNKLITALNILNYFGDFSIFK